PIRISTSTTRPPSSSAARWATSRRSDRPSTRPSAGRARPPRTSAGRRRTRARTRVRATPEVAGREAPIVGIVGGSRSDFPVLEQAVAMLDRLGVPNELRVVSAHRSPDHLYRYAETAAGRGLRVIIPGAGGAAHLPGVPA